MSTRLTTMVHTDNASGRVMLLSWRPSSRHGLISTRLPTMVHSSDVASQECHTAIAEVLIQAGADVDKATTIITQL